MSKKDTRVHETNRTQRISLSKWTIVLYLAVTMPYKISRLVSYEAVFEKNDISPLGTFVTERSTSSNLVLKALHVTILQLYSHR